MHTIHKNSWNITHWRENLWSLSFLDERTKNKIGKGLLWHTISIWEDGFLTFCDSVMGLLGLRVEAQISTRCWCLGKEAEWCLGKGRLDCWAWDGFKLWVPFYLFSMDAKDLWCSLKVFESVFCFQALLPSEEGIRDRSVSYTHLTLPTKA